MAEKPNVVGNILKSPLIAGLIVLFVLLVAGFGANVWLAGTSSSQTAASIDFANNLKVASQQLGKGAFSITSGRLEGYAAVSQARADFERNLGNLQRNTPAPGQLSEVVSAWEELSPQVSAALAGQEAMAYMRDMASDLAITLSAMQQENNRIVAALVRQSAPANEVALAQRQGVLIERMARGADRMLAAGSDNSITSFTRDSQTFKRVVDGFLKGDRELLLTAVTDEEVRGSLVKLEELYRSIAARSTEIAARSDEVSNTHAAAQTVGGLSDSLFAAANALSGSYTRMSGVIGPGSPLLSVALAGGAFLLILIISALIYRAASRSVRESAVQNEQNQAAILQLLDELADLADGDLRVQATVTESFTGAIADSINFSIDQMRGLVSKINQTSSEVRSAAEDTKGSVSQLSEASQQQAKEIADVSEAVNQMAVSIDQVSYNAAESSSVAERSVDIASKGAVVVQNTIDGMDKIRGQIQETAKRIKRLGESSQEIGDIVSLINDIADQTNILSLNAAIQASMAGDAGKGFAVVADEVQRLAERSGAAAKQISALVKTIQSDTNEAVSSMEQTTAEVVQGTRLAQDAGVSLGEIEGVSKSLAEIIENISDAARQQAASAGRISNTMKSIQEITSQTTEGTRSTVIAVGNLADMTNELRSSVTGFKLPG